MKNNDTIFETGYQKEEFFEKVRQYLSYMRNENAYEILCSKYGVNGFEKLSNVEIAEKYGFRNSK